jgi:single-strand DNA-binding protein
VANLNKVILIGRMTRDPEARSFATGGKVAKFGLVVNDRRFNKQSNQWEDEPMFIDVEAFNRGDSGKLADTIEKWGAKGMPVAVEGKLQLDQWDDKATQAKRSKHKVIAFAVQFLEKRQGDAPAGSDVPAEEPAADAGTGDEIPF